MNSFCAKLTRSSARTRSNVGDWLRQQSLTYFKSTPNVEHTSENYRYLAEYIRASSLREPELLVRFGRKLRLLPRGSMQITPEQGQFFSLLIQMLNAKDTLEIGVFTGYSSIAVALALPSDGN